MKFILTSIFIHIFLFLIFFSEKNLDLKIEKELQSSIQVDLVSIVSREKLSNIPAPLENSPSEIKEIKKAIELKKIEQPIKKIEKKIEQKTEKKLEEKLEKNLKNEVDREILTVEKKDTLLNSEKIEKDSEFFIQGDEKIAKNQNISGLSYSILKDSVPKYPIQAKKIGYKKQVVIKTKFLVNYQGEIENIEILEGIEGFGFREEVLKALKTFKFTPVFYKDEKIKLYFYKDFIFKING